MILDGPINGPWFQVWIRCWSQRFREATSDNLGSHKGAGIRQAIEAGASRRPFSKLKALLRKAAGRTVDGLRNGIGELPLHAFHAARMRKLLRSGWLAGYEPL